MTTITSNILLPNYNPEEVGLKGEKGEDGKTSYIHIAYSNSSDGGVDFSTTDPTNRSFMGSYSDFNMLDSTDPSKYEWQRVKGDSGKDGIAGKDGVGLKSTSIMYAASTSASTAPSTGWTAQVPNVAEGSYLWTKTVWDYTDSTSETGYSVARMGADGDRGQDGIAGKDGVGIKTTVIEYVVSTSGTVRPTTGWTTTIPITPQGQYLWTRTTWTYTDNTTERGYSVARQGSNGATGATGKDGVAGKDGVGLKTTTINYAASTSGTTAPASGWTAQVPTVAPNNYLWTRTVWTYTDNTSETGYSVAKMGADGAKGNDGIAGKDGVGIKSTLVEYVVSVTGTNAPASGWSTTIPITPEGQFLWTRTKWTYTDNTTETGYSVAKQGAKGATGATGAPGQNGVGIASTIIDYNKSTSSTETPTTGWTSSIPSISGGEYLWTRITLNYTNNTKAVSYTISRQGQDGSDGQLFTGEFAPTKFNEDDLWYKVVSGKVIGVFKATSGQWIEVPFESSVIAETIVGKTIQASHLTGSTIDGGDITGARFINNFDVQDGDLFRRKGSMTLENGDFTQTNTVTRSADGTKAYTNNYMVRGGQSVTETTIYDTDGTTVLSTTKCTFQGGSLNLSLRDSSGYFYGVLDAKALTKTPWINLPLNSNFEVKENNTPAYRIVYQLDGTRKVEFKGQVGPKPSSGISIEKDLSYYPFQSGTGTSFTGDTYVSSVITPAQTEFAYCATNKGSGGRVAITTGPKIIFIPAETLGQATESGKAPYFSLSALSYSI